MGLPAQPRIPLNFRPRIVSVGLIENSLGIGSSSLVNDHPAADGADTP